MPIRMPAFTLRATRMPVTSRPTRKTTVVQPRSVPSPPSCTGTAVPAASGTRRTRPPSTKPISAMNRPMPAAMAAFSSAGMARKTALPEAGQHQHGDDQTLDHHQAHRLGPAHLGGDRVRDEGVEAQAGRHRERDPADDAHQDGHHRGDQGGDPGDRRDAEQVAVGVRRGTDDQRVEHDDVGHRREGGEPGEHLAPDGRAAAGDLEEAVEAAALRRVPPARPGQQDSCVVTLMAWLTPFRVGPPDVPVGRWGCSRPGAVGPENVGTAGLHG